MIDFVPFRELETRRLILRKQRIEDAEAYHITLSSDPEVARYMLWTAHDDLDRTRRDIEGWVTKYNEVGFYRWIIETKEDGALIGVIQLVRFDESENTCEFAYMLGRTYWNRGYMTEALKRVLRFAFIELKLNKVIADHFIQNPGSGKVMQKAGMSFTGYKTGVHDNDKGFDTSACYVITKEDFINSDINSYTCRKLNKDELFMVMEMNRSFREGLAVRNNAEAFLNNPSNWIYAAVADDTVLGFAYGYELSRLNDIVNMLYIHEVGVMEEYQRRGIGYTLLSRLKEECSKRGICRFFLITGQNNIAANALYKKLGGEISAESDGNDRAYFIRIKQPQS
jgi:ribosomal-protein-alanine N-acetyltransferase